VDGFAAGSGYFAEMPLAAVAGAVKGAVCGVGHADGFEDIDLAQLGQGGFVVVA